MCGSRWLERQYDKKPHLGFELRVSFRGLVRIGRYGQHGTISPQAAMELANQLIFVAGTLFLLSILATAFTPRLGVPLLLVFLVVGMLAGEDGPGGIHFEDYGLANLAGTAGLAVILFNGGMRTRLEEFRVGLRPALALATLGVLLTAGLTGLVATQLFHLGWAQGLLIGAIVGSTDAAAVFSLLHTSAVSLNQRITSVLEIESGANDPMAVFLTLGLIAYLQAPQDFTAPGAALFFVQQMGLGFLLGWGGGNGLAYALERLELPDSLYPLMALSGGWMIFGTTALLGGSGFLAVYLAGLMVGNRPVRASAAIRRFHDGVAWLAQIGMFLMLGLLATPSRLLPIAPLALALAAALILLARPAAVVLSLAPFRFPWREQAFLSWVGLRGSVPMVLATFPLIAKLPQAQLYFDVAFFIVLLSLIVQGWSVAPVARLLKLQIPVTAARVRRIDIDLPGSGGYEIVSYRIGQHSALVGLRTKSLPIPDVSRIVSISRGGQLLPYREWGALQAGDYISLLAAHNELARLDEVFKSTRPARDLAEKRYFGEFSIDPDARVESLIAAYGAELPAEAHGKRLREFFDEIMQRPVVGDRLRFGEVELVIRKMDGERIVELGLRLPHADTPVGR
jgi:cell volume regulation protein A